MGALHTLMQKQTIEKVTNQTSLAVQAYSRSEFSKQISEVRKDHNGDTRKYKDLLANRQMGNIHKF